VYGVQYHPERNAFEWDLPERLDHSLEAVQAMQYLADFYVSETRKNVHLFDTSHKEIKALIYNWSPYATWNSNQSYPEQQTYIFKQLDQYMDNLMNQ
jgi:hypothetical protein